MDTMIALIRRMRNPVTTAAAAAAIVELSLQQVLQHIRTFVQHPVNTTVPLVGAFRLSVHVQNPFVFMTSTVTVSTTVLMPAMKLTAQLSSEQYADLVNSSAMTTLHALIGHRFVMVSIIAQMEAMKPPVLVQWVSFAATMDSAFRLSQSVLERVTAMTAATRLTAHAE
jgi:uncharacterized membrane protein